MKISVVLPVLNDPRVDRALQSIAKQAEHDEVDLVVVDGGSTDSTLDVLDRYSAHITTLIREPDRGIFDALNKGILAAKGDVVGLIGADDRYADPFVFRDVAARMEDSAIDGSYGDLVYQDDAGRVVRYWRSGSFSRRKVHCGWIAPHFTLFLRREVYERCGLFDLDYNVAADYDHQLRMYVRHGVRLGYIDRVLVEMTLGGHSNRSLRHQAIAFAEQHRAWTAMDRRWAIVANLGNVASKIPQFLRRAPRR